MQLSATITQRRTSDFTPDLCNVARPSNRRAFGGEASAPSSPSESEGGEAGANPC